MADLKPEDAPLPAGRIFGHYQILEAVGRGGMAAVYRAQDLDSGLEVALKVIHPKAAGNPDFVRRFHEYEFKHLTDLNHPNIVLAYENGEVDGRHYLAMEYVHGENLSRRMKRGDLLLSEALEIVRQVAEGLSAAHLNGIVHRDIKPSNILLQRQAENDPVLPRPVGGDSEVTEETDLDPVDQDDEPPEPPGGIPHVERARFIGRKRELTDLQRSLTLAAAGRTAVQPVVGPAGAGKTRLLRAFQVRALFEDAAFAWGGAEGGAPYRPLGVLCRRLLENVGDRADAIRARHEPVLAALDPPAGTTPPRTVDTDAAAALFTDLAEAGFETSGTANQVWVLDDFQRAGELELEMIPVLGSFALGLRVLVVPLIRHDPERPTAVLSRLHAAFKRGADLGWCTRPIRLRPLTRGMLARLVLEAAALRRPGAVSGGDEELVAGLTWPAVRGNPGRLLDLLDDLFATGAVRMDGTLVRVEDAEAVADTVQDMEAAELAPALTGLGARPRRLLTALAFLGGTGPGTGELTPTALLSRVTGMPDHELHVSLRSLHAAGLAEEHRGRWCVPNPRIRARIRDEAEDDVRLAISRRIAEALEDSADSDDPSVVARLAMHNLEAGRLEAAFAGFLQAGDLARRTYMMEDARRHYESAYEILESAGERLENRNLLADMDNWFASRQEYEQALRHRINNLSPMVAKLVDFGVSEAAAGMEDADLADDTGDTEVTVNEEITVHTADGETRSRRKVLGTPKYMSPEQIRKGPVDGRSDVYSLGLIAYIMLSGRHPFPAESSKAYLRMHLNDEPPPLSVVAPHLPHEVEQVVMLCLAKDPGDRPTAEALGRDLDRLMRYLRIGPRDRRLSTSDPSSVFHRREAERVSPVRALLNRVLG